MSWRKSYVLFGLVLLSNPSIETHNYNRKIRRNDQNDSFPSDLRLFVNDWIAQWDPLYNSWFYYNTKSGW